MKKSNLHLFLFFVLTTIFLFSSQSAAQTLKIYCIDVNQGDATLIVTPNGRSILIDCGATSGFLGQDCGPASTSAAESVFDIITNKANLSSIDYFVCTHYHDDHMGAFRNLHNKLTAANITINNYYDRGYDKLTSSGNVSTVWWYNHYVTTSGQNRTKLLSGQTIDIDNNVDIECIVGCGITKGETEQNRFPDEENDSSLGLLFSYNDFEFLISGDLTEEVEHELVEKRIFKDIDVYQMNHHGSRHSSNICLMLAFRPEVCIVSNGSYPNYNHPPEEKISEILEIFPNMYFFQTNKNLFEAGSQYTDKIENTEDKYIGDLDCTGFEGTILIEVNEEEYSIELTERGLKYIYQIQK